MCKSFNSHTTNLIHYKQNNELSELTDAYPLM